MLSMNYAREQFDSPNRFVGDFYGGKLKDLSEGRTQMLTTLVLLLFSTSEGSGRGE